MLHMNEDRYLIAGFDLYIHVLIDSASRLFCFVAITPHQRHTVRTSALVSFQMVPEHRSATGSNVPSHDARGPWVNGKYPGILCMQIICRLCE
jgi:hypothetical protein